MCGSRHAQVLTGLVQQQLTIPASSSSSNPSDQAPLFSALPLWFVSAADRSQIYIYLYNVTVYLPQSDFVALLQPSLKLAEGWVGCSEEGMAIVSEAGTPQANEFTVRSKPRVPIFSGISTFVLQSKRESGLGLFWTLIWLAPPSAGHCQPRLASSDIAVPCCTCLALLQPAAGRPPNNEALHLRSYTGWGINASNIILVPSQPLPANFQMPVYDPCSSVRKPTYTSNPKTTAIGVGVGVGGAVLLASLAVVLQLSHTRAR